MGVLTPALSCASMPVSENTEMLHRGERGSNANKISVRWRLRLARSRQVVPSTYDPRSKVSRRSFLHFSNATDGGVGQAKDHATHFVNAWL